MLRLVRAGTTLRYSPGIVTGGSGYIHDCGRSRSIGFFLEPLVCIALFAKKVWHNSSCIVHRPSLPAAAIFSSIKHTCAPYTMHKPKPYTHGHSDHDVQLCCSDCSLCPSHCEASPMRQQTPAWMFGAQSRCHCCVKQQDCQKGSSSKF